MEVIAGSQGRARRWDFRKRPQSSTAYWLVLGDFLIPPRINGPGMAPLPAGLFAPISVTDQENLPQVCPKPSW